MLSNPYKISVHSSVGELRYTAYGRNVAEAAAGLVETFALQHPKGVIYNMVAPFVTIPKVW
ncbi:hypothetical protein [Nonomuraea sp. NPDC049400]|uniref:hypothetical protein n=1 Tax=Nonomuraea sp. NPDC049400 TaxID=3364352 RepID=UPI0037AB2E8D